MLAKMSTFQKQQNYKACKGTGSITMNQNIDNRNCLWEPPYARFNKNFKVDVINMFTEWRDDFKSKERCDNIVTSKK